MLQLLLLDSASDQVTMRSLSTSTSVFVITGFSGKPVQNDTFLHFVAKNCEILILTKTKHVDG